MRVVSNIAALSIVFTLAGAATPAWAGFLQSPGSASVIASLPEQSVTSSSDPYSNALELLVAGKLDEAEAGFNAVLKANPRAVRALLGLAQVAFNRKQPQLGEKYLQQALVTDAKDAYAQSSMGRYLLTTGRASEAEKFLKEAVRLAPDQVSMRMDLADLYNGALNQPKEALKEYNNVLAKDPKHAGAHYAKGVALQKSGDKSGAAAEYDQAIKLAPENPIPVEALARLQAEQGKFDNALATLDKLLGSTPKLFRTRILRSEILAAKGDAKGALKELQQAAADAPKIADVQLRLAMGLHAAGRQSEAMNQYERVIQLDPKLAAAHNNLATLAMDMKLDIGRAEKSARKAVELEPKNANFHDTLGKVLLRKGKSKDALSEFATVQKLAPTDAPLLANIGLALAASEPKTAREFLEAALKQSTSFPAAAEAQKQLAVLKK